jgi:hypothetical protein
LSRPSTSATFTHKSYGKSYDSAATLNYRSNFIHGYVKQATTTALAIKALRITTSGFGAGVTFTAGAYVKVKWIGVATDLPRTNAIPEAPNDGRSYSRKNGLWVPDPVQLVSTTTFAGKVRIDVPLPDGYKSFQVRYRNVQPTATSTFYLWLFGSTDGTTFYMTDGNYNWRHLYTASTGTTAPQWTAAAGAGMGIPLMPLSLTLNAAWMNSGILDIMQAAAGMYTQVGVYTQSQGSAGIFTQLGAGYVAVGGPWKAFRIQTGAGAGESYQRGDLDVYGYT